MQNELIQYYKPTMKVYEETLKIKKNGILPKFSDISRDDLYILYVVEGKYIYEIAKLYNITETEVSKKRKKYGIMSIDSIWYKKDGNNMIEKLFKALEINQDYASSYTSFEECLYPILEYMKDSKSHLLREFWQFTNNKRSFLESKKAKTAKDGYIKAFFCLKFFSMKNIVEETEELSYKITNLGKKILEECKNKKLNSLNIKTINEMLSKSNNIHIIKSANKIIEEIDFKNIKIKRTKKENESNIKPIKNDYEKINKLKKAIGDEAEELVYKMEKERLEKEGEFNLKPVQESKENGDGAGFDIKSFKKVDGKYEPIYIEVKATDKSINEPFDITANEVEASKEYDKSYYIYRIAKIHSNVPQMYQISGSIEKNFNLTPTSYKAQKKSWKIFRTFNNIFTRIINKYV